ncbi:polysaccharide deacetylase family protein [Natranaerofaba carboxydovora]|uniref:polysaccharide deacetylase family protein n=1 Tax=Natranaerofaba carboxydovora TaxID=2742683 RepID=UPI001F12B311|nr:polysaccharide deacetylase family protein [Natranaerofaba carboxydovora]UMZ73417.1 Peptidoglycan-N-acetylmuramic acid deacetylase PdaA [Natranaerofaba carboxydovora]
MRKRKLIIGLLILKLALIFFFMNFDNSIEKDDNAISPGVKLENVPLEKELGVKPDEDETKEFIKNHTKDLEIEPENAYIDPSTGGIVPGTTGKVVDTEKTLNNIYKAKKGENVSPVFTTVEPSENTNDLTPAPIYQGNPNIKKVSFICNVAWGSEHIDELIEVLDKHEVKISFFLEGRWAKNNPQKTKFIFDKGHEIGNHAYSHYNMSTIDRNLIKEEINKTSETIESIIDEEVKLFGPPAGDFDDRVLEVADDLGVYTVMWSLDTIDWMEPGIDYMTDKILDGIHPGAFILMHPTEDTVTALDEILSGLKEKSYKVVPVSEQLGVDIYEN